MQAKTLQLPHETLSYVDVGSGDTTLLFLHGAFINKSYWRAQLKHFSGDYRCIAVDLAGHGASTHQRKERRVVDYARDVLALIGALSLKRVVLIGHSFGADVMLETVALNASRVVGVVEVDHLKHVGTEVPAEVIGQVVAGLRADFAGTAAAFARQALLTEATDASLVQRLLRDYAATDQATGIRVFEGIPGYATRELELLNALPLKLYSLHVEYSATDEPSLAAATGGNYELSILAGTCHYPMVEAAEAFNKALEYVLVEI